MPPLDYAQYRHSIITPDATADFGVQVCLTEDLTLALKSANPEITLVAYSPLLDGGFEVGMSLPDAYNTESNREIVAEVQADAKTLNVSPSALVLKKISDSGIMPLTMTGKLDRLKGNLALFGK